MIKHHIEHGSPEWYEIRRGMVTGTNLKSVVAPRSEPLKIIDELIAEDVSGMSDDEDGYVGDDMQRGIDLEPVAKREYTALTGNEIEDVGFLQSERWPKLGISPDGLIGVLGAIETKCPKTRTHVRYIRENVRPKEYHYQILDYFLVDEELEWVDFVSFDPRFAVKPLFIHRTWRSDVQKELAEASEKLDSFFSDLELIRTRIIFGTSVVVAHRDEKLKATIVE